MIIITALLRLPALCNLYSPPHTGSSSSRLNDEWAGVAHAVPQDRPESSYQEAAIF